MHDIFSVGYIYVIPQLIYSFAVIIKNGIMIAFMIANQMSPYYRSTEFSRVMESISKNERLFEFNTNGGKFRVISRKVDSIPKALAVLRKL